MNEIDASAFRELIAQKAGEGFDPEKIKVVERNVSEVAFLDVMGVKPYDEELDALYGKDNWAKYYSEETTAGHCDIIAYVEPRADDESAQATEGHEPVDDVLLSKSVGDRTLTLLRGGLYEDKKEK